jgi:hypothetical protein
VGRISGIINHAYNNYHNEKVAFWGFFESENCSAVVAHLFSTVEKWAMRHGKSDLRGPVNPSTNHECGLQISEFDRPPFIMMPQNPAYYVTLIEALGHTKIKDLQAWLIEPKKTVVHPDLQEKIIGIKKRKAITIRGINMKCFKEEVKIMYEIYSDAWKNNWGFAPMSFDEFNYFAKDLKLVIEPKMAYIVEVSGEPAAFVIALPNINQALIKLRQGKLLPLHFLKLLWDIKIKKTINECRVAILGIKIKFQYLPLGGMLYIKLNEQAPRIGLHLTECSWILEDNRPMQRALSLMNAKLYKAYRIYEKKLVF